MKFRHTNFMRLIYATLLALPFVAILSRVIYVQSNKNAYQSYYGETINEQITKDISYNNLQENGKYTLVLPITLSNPQNANVTIEVNNLTFNGTPSTNNGATWDITTTNKVQIRGHQNDTYIVFLFYNDNETTFYYKSTTDTYSFTFNLTLPNTKNNYLDSILTFQQITYNDYSYIDNVFEYSVNKFIQNNNFGKINLFQWTTNLFFDSNDVNNMYVGFINWYLNYTLLVSATYILFLVLMWFINYARRLLERGMYYDF